MNSASVRSCPAAGRGNRAGAGARYVGLQRQKPAPPPADEELRSFRQSTRLPIPARISTSTPCGNWVKNNPIPADQMRWARSFSLLQERNRYLLWQELDAAAKSPKTPLEKKYGDYYAACMNTSLVEEKGIKPLEPALMQIGGLKNSRSLAPRYRRAGAEGNAAPLFRFGNRARTRRTLRSRLQRLRNAGLSLPDRDYYLVDNKRFQDIRKQYRRACGQDVHAGWRRARAG